MTWVLLGPDGSVFAEVRDAELEESLEELFFCNGANREAAQLAAIASARDLRGEAVH